MRLTVGAAFLTTVAALAPTRAAGFETTPVALNSHVFGLLSRPSDHGEQGPLPVVILLSETVGADGRTNVYAERLLSLGVAVLDADFGCASSMDGAGIEVPRPPAEHHLGLALEALRTAPMVDLQRVAVIGLGEGARAVLLAATTQPLPITAAALLYPGCDAPLLRIADRAAAGLAGVTLLLVHGAADPANEPEACGALAGVLRGSPGVAHVVLPGATYAWDVAEYRRAGPTRLPAPGDPTHRLLAVPDAFVTLIALDRMLSVLLPPLSATGAAR